MKDSGIRKDALIKHLKDQIKSSTDAHNKLEEIVTKSKLTVAHLQHEKMELQAQVQYWKLAAQETRIPAGIWKDTMTILNVTKDDVGDFLAGG